MAGRIVIESQATSALRDGLLSVAVTLSNSGNATAYDLEATARLSGQEGQAPKVTRLKPDTTQGVVLTLEAPTLRPGEQTLLIETHYRDRHGFPFSVLATAPVVTAIPPRGPPPPELTLSDVQLDQHATVTLSLHNPAAVPRAVKATLFTPHGMRVDGPTEHDQLLPPHGHSHMEWPLRRTSATPGGTYRLFAQVDYEESGLNRSRVVEGRALIPRDDLPVRRFIAVAPWGVVLLLFLGLLGPRLGHRPPAWLNRAFFVVNGAALGLALLFLLHHLPLHLLLTDSFVIGGDTPAHTYLAAHLKAHLFGQGRLVSWAGGWWCGFPSFQFYFTLPYVLIALLSTLIPLNIALKLVSVLGVMLLPIAAWGAGRLARLPQQICTLLGVAMIPLLFDHSHVMWGVNLYSTLAGMISNSLSFPIMLLMLASALHDSDEGRFRLRTTLLMVLMISSHFFTSIVGALCLLVLPFCHPRTGVRRALRVLFIEGVLAVLLMSWWIVPLLWRREYAVDFGANWPLNLVDTIPPFLWCFAAMADATLIWLVVRWRHWPAALRRFAVVTSWMMLVSTLLFFWGDHLSPVFVNVRLWPFMVYSTTALAMVGLGKLIGQARWPTPLLAAATFVLLAWGPDRPNQIRTWARWNYGGLEALPRAHVVQTLADALRDTPGRLANDLHPANESLGSSRIFEAMPHLAGKPVLEGGLVNSAWGALFSYYIQGETSRTTAGFPTLVQPTTFNFTNATQHLTLMNVSHFIARGSRTRQALRDSPDWVPLRTVERWELFENRLHDGRYVCVPQHRPQVVRTARRQEAGLAWLTHINAIGQPFVLLKPGESGPSGDADELSYAEFMEVLAGMTNTPGSVATLYPSDPIVKEEISDDTIRFTTTAVGRPHLVKCTYYPRWQATGAEAVHMVTPGFMLVTPTQPDVTLRFVPTAPEWTGYLLTALGLIASAATVILSRRHSRLGRRRGAC